MGMVQMAPEFCLPHALWIDGCPCSGALAAGRGACLQRLQLISPPACHRHSSIMVHGQTPAARSGCADSSAAADASQCWRTGDHNRRNSRSGKGGVLSSFRRKSSDTSARSGADRLASFRAAQHSRNSLDAQRQVRNCAECRVQHRGGQAQHSVRWGSIVYHIRCSPAHSQHAMTWHAGCAHISRHFWAMSCHAAARGLERLTPTAAAAASAW